MLETFYLSLIQALTEFLPVSSTAHLIVLSKIFHLPTAGRLTEVALHMGTLGVVLVYFRKDVLEGFQGLLSLLKGKTTPSLHRWLMIALGTLPVVIVGYLVNRYVGKGLRTLEVMGWASIFSGLILFLVDRSFPTHKKLESLTYQDALIVGVLQIIALIPGASRMGTTLLGARMLGYNRVQAARFSFLLSIPVVIGATILMMAEASRAQLSHMAVEMMLTALFCFVLGYGVLMLLMAWLKKRSFAPFALYRLVFGGYLLYMVYM